MLASSTFAYHCLLPSFMTAPFQLVDASYWLLLSPRGVCGPPAPDRFDQSPLCLSFCHAPFLPVALSMHQVPLFVVCGKAQTYGLAAYCILFFVYRPPNFFCCVWHSPLFLSYATVWSALSLAQFWQPIVLCSPSFPSLLTVYCSRFAQLVSPALPPTSDLNL